MIARAGSGWQTVLADLSLILFMVTAGALAQAEDGAAAVASPQAEPLALYRAEPGAPPLGQWLAGEAADDRHVLTIVAQYPPGGRNAALAGVAVLAEAAGPGELAVRVVVEPGAGGTTASLAYDDPRATLAQGLQGSGQQNLSRKDAQ